MVNSGECASIVSEAEIDAVVTHVSHLCGVDQLPVVERRNSWCTAFNIHEEHHLEDQLLGAKMYIESNLVYKLFIRSAMSSYRIMLLLQRKGSSQRR